MAKKSDNTEDIKFTKEQLYLSKKYEMQRDLIAILLDDSKSYSYDEVEKIIKEFKNKEVE
jgi:hypothetical protein|nr:MAG TPA: hypothetical protein [Caudoviricetes sp.]